MLGLLGTHPLSHLWFIYKLFYIMRAFMSIIVFKIRKIKLNTQNITTQNKNVHHYQYKAKIHKLCKLTKMPSFCDKLLPWGIQDWRFFNSFFYFFDDKNNKRGLYIVFCHILIILVLRFWIFLIRIFDFERLILRINFYLF